VFLSSRGRKSRPCVGISIETVEAAFFVTGLETLQILGVEMSTGDSNTKYLIIKLSLLKKASKKRNNEIITKYLTGATVL
jgi:hypothetical protein